MQTRMSWSFHLPGGSVITWTAGLVRAKAVESQFSLGAQYDNATTKWNGSLGMEEARAHPRPFQIASPGPSEML